MAQEQVYARHNTLNKPTQASKGLEQLYAGVQRPSADGGRRLQMRQEPTPDGNWQNGSSNSMRRQYGIVEESLVQITPHSANAFQSRADEEKLDDELTRFFIPQPPRQVMSAMTSVAEEQLQMCRELLSCPKDRWKNRQHPAPSHQNPRSCMACAMVSKGGNASKGSKEPHLV